MYIRLRPAHVTLLCLCCLCTVVLASTSTSARADGGVSGELIAITEQLLLDNAGELADGGTVYQPALISEYYRTTDYRAAWNNRDQARRVLAMLGASTDDGLNPADYHYGELKQLLEQQRGLLDGPARRRARIDVLLTDGVLLYARHLLEGKVDPRTLDPSFNYRRRNFEAQNIIARLRDAIGAQRVVETVLSLRPDIDFYQRMQAALTHYRELAATAPFQPVPSDLVLRPGLSHPNVAALRRRLERIGYVDGTAGDPERFDPQLEAAVRRFQSDNAIDTDGIVGAQSFELLNLSHARRAELLRINLDRVRWISQGLSDDFIMVNIAGFELYYARNRKVVWETPVMVGTVAYQTPVFTARLRYLEFNPTWTVPRSIVGRSLFPRFRADPQYVLDNRYYLYDRNGQRADPFAIDWAAYNGSSFPYSVVQQPGPKNALGRVKFIFPNRYAVYLHDTPARELFSRSARAFSSGCVRVQNPLEFAEVLLDDPQQWSLDQIESLVDSGKPQHRVFLERDVDVMLMYWTTSPAPGGRIQFHADIYDKDAAAIAALNAAPEVIGLAKP